MERYFPLYNLHGFVNINELAYLQFFHNSTLALGPIRVTKTQQHIVSSRAIILLTENRHLLVIMKRYIANLPANLRKDEKKMST